MPAIRNSATCANSSPLAPEKKTSRMLCLFDRGLLCVNSGSFIPCKRKNSQAIFH